MDEEEFLAYNIVKWQVIRNNQPQIQIQNWKTGALHEIGLAIARNLDTNELILHPVHHFTDPDSQSWFPDSEPWNADDLPQED